MSDPKKASLLVAHLQLAPDGQVWHTFDGTRARSAGQSLREFMLMPWLSKVDQIRILGCRENIPLILELYEHWQRVHPRLGVKEHKGGIYVGELGMKLGKQTTERPDLMLDQHRQAKRWRRVNQATVDSYAVAAPQLNETKRLKRLQQHPAYPAVSFVFGMHADSAAKLLAEIIDPRWFFDDAKEDLEQERHVSRLESHLGVMTDVAQAWFYRNKKGSRAIVRRFELVAKSWGGGSSPGPADCMENPKCFISRLMVPFLHDKNGNHNAKVEAMTAGSRHFIRFITQFWLYKLSGHPENWVPEKFFSNKGEIAAFNRHCASLTTSKVFHVQGKADQGEQTPRRRADDCGDQEPSE